MIKPVILLTISNLFMTFAWYGHLKLRWLKNKPMAIVVLFAWSVALLEYCFQVPGNRSGYSAGLTGYQLKILQEAITLVVFVVFAGTFLGEKLRWNYAVSFLFLGVAVAFAFGFKAK